jgi:hypothetical protein
MQQVWTDEHPGRDFTMMNWKKEVNNWTSPKYPQATGKWELPKGAVIQKIGEIENEETTQSRYVTIWYTLPGPRKNEVPETGVEAKSEAVF